MGDDIVDGEEVGGVFLGADQRELVGDGLLPLSGDALGETAVGRRHHHVFQPILRAPACGHRLVRVVVAQVIEREGDAREKVGGGGDGLRAGAEQPRHLGGGFQVALGIGGEALAGMADRRALTDAGDDIVERARIGGGIERIVGGEQRHIGVRAQRLRQCQPARIRPGPRHRHPQPHRAGAGFAQGVKQGAVATERDQQQVVGMVEQIGQVQHAVALFGAAVAQRQQPGQPAPTGARGGVGQDVRRGLARGIGGKHQPRAHHQPQATRSARSPCCRVILDKNRFPS